MRYFLIHTSIMTLWAGGDTANNGRVKSGTPGLPYHDFILVLVNHGGEGWCILWVTLPGFPGCPSGVPTVPP